MSGNASAAWRSKHSWAAAPWRVGASSYCDGASRGWDAWGHRAGARSRGQQQDQSYVACSVCSAWLWQSRLDKGDGQQKCKCGTAFADIAAKGASSREPEMYATLRNVLASLQAIAPMVQAEPAIAQALSGVVGPLTSVIAAAAPVAAPEKEKPLEELRKVASKARAHLETLRQQVLAAHTRIAKAEEQLTAAKECLAEKEGQLEPAERAATDSETEYRKAVTAVAAAAGQSHRAAAAYDIDADGDAVLGASPGSDEAAAHLKRVLDAYEQRRAKRQCAEALGQQAAADAAAAAAKATAEGQRL